MGYSKLVSWSVENFMSVEKGTCAFDSQGIINIKGYNDSGKSSMLRALDVLFYNIRPNSQVSFIRDGADHFRIVAKFDDGVVILRDKYSNGQSLYEMYKENELLYTTKVNGVLSRIKEVPEPIQKYLGLIDYEGTLLNSRSCFEKQLLVQTSGGDNYKLLNAVLKSEELATASVLINKDKNIVGNELSKTETELEVHKEIVQGLEPLTEDIVSVLEREDALLSEAEVKKQQVENINGLKKQHEEIQIFPQVDVIDKDYKGTTIISLSNMKKEVDSIFITDEVETIITDKLVSLDTMLENKKAVDGLHITDEVTLIDIDRVNDLDDVKSLKEDLAKTFVTDEVEYVDTEKLQVLQSLFTSKQNYDGILQQANEVECNIADVQSQLDQIQQDSKGFVRCPNCGELISTDVASV